MFCVPTRVSEGEQRKGMETHPADHFLDAVDSVREETGGTGLSTSGDVGGADAARERKASARAQRCEREVHAHLGGIGDDVVSRGELERSAVPSLAVVEDVEVEGEAEEGGRRRESGSDEGESSGGDGEGLHVVKSSGGERERILRASSLQRGKRLWGLEPPRRELVYALGRQEDHRADYTSSPCRRPGSGFRSTLASGAPRDKWGAGRVGGRGGSEAKSPDFRDE